MTAEKWDDIHKACQVAFSFFNKTFNILKRQMERKSIFIIETNEKKKRLSFLIKFEINLSILKKLTLLDGAQESAPSVAW